MPCNAIIKPNSEKNKAKKEFHKCFRNGIDYYERNETDYETEGRERVLQRKIKRILYIAVVLAGTVHLLTGCAIEKTNRTKVRDLDYHVVTEAEMPEELKAQIEEKKAADFKLTYETPEHLYIVRGYGEQETGGYSIQVAELYLSSNAVFFKSTLIGPRKGENVAKSPSYPYIVVQTEKIDKNVVFE